MKHYIIYVKFCYNYENIINFCAPKNATQDEIEQIAKNAILERLQYHYKELTYNDEDD